MTIVSLNFDNCFIFDNCFTFDNFYNAKVEELGMGEVVPKWRKDSRGEEHLLNKQAADENKSVLKLHSNHHHNGAYVRYPMRVTGLHNDSLDRHVTEGVNISNFSGGVLMNRRGELGGVRIERQQYRRWGDNN